MTEPQQALLQCIETTTGPSVLYSIIWLHGLGADGHDFAGIVPEVVLADRPDIRFIFPHAPKQPVTLNGGMVMRSWYDLYGLEIDTPEDEVGIKQAADSIRQLIEREQQRGVAANHIILAGFSQGGALALYTALTHPQPLAAILALSTYLPLARQLNKQHEGLQTYSSIFQAHGDRDAVVSMSLGEAAREAIQQLGNRVDWRSYPMEHSVSMEELQDISQWLENVFFDLDQGI
ncbi:MAG TPA: carboxylesterase [Gammaproteobacteria bacterium]|nr:carboxylesterase [Gammaproteobacteria bacterium]